MPTIKKFLQGIYEHSNLFKIKNPSVTVGDSEVKEITPFRGVIQKQGSIISSDDFNEMQKNFVYFIETEYSENYGSGVDAYVIKNLESEQELFEGLKLKFIIPKTNLFDNPVIVFKNNTYELKANVNESLKKQNLTKDNIVNVVYKDNYFLTEIITQATENTSGTAKIYSETEAESDIERIVVNVKAGTTSNAIWNNLINALNHTKILTIKNVVKLIGAILKPATENDFGLINYKTIRNVSPRPDLSPYIPFTKGYRDSARDNFVIRANNADTWIPQTLNMYNPSGSFVGAYHTNGSRAYYKVPGRNGGNWCEIMDNHDMNIRDNKISNIEGQLTAMNNDRNGIRNSVTQLWAKASDLYYRSDNDTVRDIRLVGFISPIVAHANQATERVGYIVTGLVNGNNDHIIDQVQMRAFQIKRGGSGGQNWYTVPFG